MSTQSAFEVRRGARQLRKQSCAIRGVAQSELRNPESCAIRQMQLRNQSCATLGVAQSVECSCAIRVAQSELHNPGSCAILGVAQSELRNPGSCALLAAQSYQRVAQSKLRNPVKSRNLTLFPGTWGIFFRASESYVRHQLGCKCFPAPCSFFSHLLGALDIFCGVLESDIRHTLGSKCLPAPFRNLFELLLPRAGRALELFLATCRHLPSALDIFSREVRKRHWAPAWLQMSPGAFELL